MAITFTTGTINEIDAVTVGTTMAAKIRDDVVAHPAWDLVEEFTAASGVVRWYVFKCLASASGLADDFYVVMGRTLATGELRITIGEGYNSGTHVLSFFPPNGSAATAVFDSTGRAPTTFTLGTAQIATATGQPLYHGWVPIGTSTKWWITTAEDGFTVAFNGAANGFAHVGAYTPLTSASIPTPVHIYGSATGYGITRNPAVASQTITTYGLTLNNTIPALGFQGDLRYNDKLQANQRPVAELGLQMTQNLSGGPDVATLGGFLGKMKRVRIGLNAPAGFAFGDAYVLNGRLWVPYLPSDARIWDTGVSS